MILAVAAGTQLTRWLPFGLFPDKKTPPTVVTYLGRVLPAAMMGLLVVYCLKGVSWLSSPHGAPELLAIAAVIILVILNFRPHDPANLWVNRVKAMEEAKENKEQS